MERYFLISGTIHHNCLPNADLKHVKNDLNLLKTLFQKSCGLMPLPESVTQQGESIGPNLEAITTWNHEPEALPACVILYHSSHGVILDDQHYLIEDNSKLLAGDTWNVESLVQTARIGRAFCGGRTRQLLVILDTCHAAAADGSMTDVFRKYDHESRVPRGCIVDFLYASRSREEASDGKFAAAFVSAVLALGEENAGSPHINLRHLVTEIQQRMPKGQTIELRQVLGQGGDCQRLPNPSFKKIEVRFGPSDIVRELQDILRTMEESRRIEVDQEWLWYAWYEAGRGLDEELDSGWPAHLAARFESGLSGGIECCVISLLAGFCENTVELATNINNIQRKFNKRRRADLDASRRRGRTNFQGYMAWRKTLSLEIQVEHYPGAEPLIHPVVIESGSDPGRRHNPMPLTTPFKGHLPRVLSMLSGWLQRKVSVLPIRHLLPNDRILEGLGTDLYDLEWTIRQSAPLTVHSLERWGLLRGDSEYAARKWKGVLQDMLVLRKHMNPHKDVRTHIGDRAGAWLHSLEAAVPVIYVGGQPTGLIHDKWEEWPDFLRQHWRVNGDASASLVFDSPGFTPWRLASMLVQ